MLNINPLAIDDFDGIEGEGALRVAGVNPDEFVAGLLAGSFFEDAHEVAGIMKADLFNQFAAGGHIVIFAGIDVAGAGAHPLAWRGVFSHRAALQVKLTRIVKHKDVHGSVQKFFMVDDRASLLPENVVVEIDDIKDVGYGGGHHN